MKNPIKALIVPTLSASRFDTHNVKPLNAASDRITRELEIFNDLLNSGVKLGRVCFADFKPCRNSSLFNARVSPGSSFVLF